MPFCSHLWLHWKEISLFLLTRMIQFPEDLFLNWSLITHVSVTTEEWNGGLEYQGRKSECKQSQALFTYLLGKIFDNPAISASNCDSSEAGALESRCSSTQWMGSRRSLSNGLEYHVLRCKICFHLYLQKKPFEILNFLFRELWKYIENRVYWEID